MRRLAVITVIVVIGIFAVIFFTKPHHAPLPVDTDNTPAPVVHPVVPPPVTPVVTVKTQPNTPYDEGCVIELDRPLPSGRLVIVSYEGRKYIMRSRDNVTWTI